jgi:putative nucleotidyltransferase-like protein
MMSRSDATCGRLVAGILAGAWRHDPPKLAAANDHLERVAPLLVASGAAGLAWNRISRHPQLREAPAAAALRDAYRALALEEVRKEAALRKVADLFGAANMEPMIFKGWAAARSYAKPYLRPFGDIDICAPPGRHREATELLRQRAVPGLEAPDMWLTHEMGIFVLDCDGEAIQIDLHASLGKFLLPSATSVYDRSLRLPLGERTIRVPCPEDHLRLVAIHFLKHGGWRPLWLCDVAAMLEALPCDFDWDRCLGDDPRARHWIACALELAGELLDARIDHVPSRCRVQRLPRWLTGTVLKEWRAPYAARFAARPLAHMLARPSIIPAELRARWPNKVKATIAVGGRFDRMPRLPYQMADVAGVIWRRLAASRRSYPIAAPTRAAGLQGPRT